MQVSLLISGLLLASASCSSNPQGDDKPVKPNNDSMTSVVLRSLDKMIRENVGDYPNLLACALGTMTSTFQFFLVFPEEIEITGKFISTSFVLPLLILLLQKTLFGGLYPRTTIDSECFVRARLHYHGLHTVAMIIATSILFPTAYPLAKMASFSVPAIACFHMAWSRREKPSILYYAASLLMAWCLLVKHLD